MNRRTVAQSLYDAVNANDEAAIEAVVSDAYVEHGGPAAQPPGRDGLLWFVRFATAAFPNLLATVEDMVIEGDMVAVRLTVTGTHAGPIFGRQPTGKDVSFTGMDFLRISGDQVVERWTIRDFRGLIEQLDG